MATTVEVLQAARAKIEKPETWIKGDYARTAPDGNPIGPACDNAKCWCTAGAVDAASDYTYTNAWYYLTLALPSPWVEIVHFNDAPDTTHDDVLALFDRAIAKAKETA